MISIVVPWHNCPELIETFERNKMGAEVVVVDNASHESTNRALHAMTQRLNGIYLYNKENQGVSTACNQGFELTRGDIVVFMNSDTETPEGWLEQVERDVEPGHLYGPSLQTNHLEGKPYPYIEGYCIAATRDTWRKIGLWNEAYKGLYWEDNDLAWRAALVGVGLYQTNWQVIHYSNYTSRRTTGAYDRVGENRARFLAMVNGAVL